MKGQVILPRDVAEAIEFIRKVFAESAVHDVKWLEGTVDDDDAVRMYKDTILNFIAKKGWPDQFSPNHPIIIYHEALVNGYEVEKTPEEKVRKYYKEFDQTREVEANMAVVVEEVLGMLGIKIKGVNT